MRKIPLTKIIQNDILNEIASRRMKPGDKLPTEQEYMERYQVSRITVSNALSELAKQNIISRYPKRGSFVNSLEDTERSVLGKEPSPELFTRQAQEDEKIKIGFLIPSIRDLFALNLIHGISSCFYNEPKYYLNITYSCDQASEEYIIGEMIRQGTKGILVFPVDQEIYNEKILEMKVNKYPFVLVDRYLPGLDTHYVISDNVRGGQLAVQHLCELGHQNILLCCGSDKDTLSVKERIQGYQQELLSQGRPLIPDSIISNILPRMQQENQRLEIETQLLNPKYTAVITTDSATALFLYDFYQKHGIKIPEEKSLISYDAPVANVFELNPFTYIDQEEYRMGQEAGNIMKCLLTQKDRQTAFTQTVISPKLVVNKTTGRVPDFAR